MTYDQILSMLKEAKLPIAYDHFAEGESPAPPFMVFLFPSSDNFAADGRVYQRIDVLHVELYGGTSGGAFSASHLMQFS